MTVYRVELSVDVANTGLAAIITQKDGTEVFITNDAYDELLNSPSGASPGVIIWKLPGP